MRRLCAPLFLLVFLSSCQEDLRGPTDPPHLAEPVFAISDAVHSAGNEHFYFLPPLVPAPNYAGTTDPSLSPTVVICEWDGSRCVDVIAYFTKDQGTGSEILRYDAAGGFYIVNWHTNQCITGECTLDASKTYRLRVVVGALELGYADVDVVSSGKELRNVQTNEYIGLVNGRTLPVKFRIEQGAVKVTAPGTPVAIDSKGGNIATEDGSVALSFPEGALAENTNITIEPATDLPITVDDYASPVSLGPDGQTFERPVTLTLGFEPSKLPDGVPPSALRMVTWAEDHWEEVPGGVFNEIDNTISAEISHFSYYYLAVWPNSVSGVPGYTLFPTLTTQVNVRAAYVRTEGAAYSYWDARLQSWVVVRPSETVYPIPGALVTFSVVAGPLVAAFPRPSAPPTTPPAPIGYAVTDQSGYATVTVLALSLGTAQVVAYINADLNSSFTLMVTTQPSISPTPQGRSQTLIQVLPGGVASAAVQVGNGGSYPLDNLRVVGPVRNCYSGAEYPWLAHSFASTVAPTTLTFTVTPPAGTPYGIHDMCFTLHGDYAQDYAYGVRVSVQEVLVTPSPHINPFPQGPTQNVIEVAAGASATKNVPIANSGGSTLSGLALVGPVRNCYNGQEITWLTHNWASTSAPTTLTLTVSPPANTAPGTYDYCFDLRARSAGAPDYWYGARVVVRPGWATLPSMLSARWVHGVGVLDGLLYAVGGEPANNAPTAAVESYNPATQRWTALAPLNAPRAYLGVTGMDGKLYAAGGVSGGSVVSRFEAYDPMQGSWSTLAPLSTPRWYVELAAVGGRVYAIGGRDATGAPLGTMERYDPATGWSSEELSPMPTPRFGHRLAVVNDIIYAIGGIGANGTAATVEAYNPATNTWTTKAPLPSVLTVMAVGVVNGMIYTAGGYIGDVLANVYVYNPATNTWTSGPPLPFARSAAGGAVIGGTFYVVGGHNGAAPIGTVQAFSP